MKKYIPLLILSPLLFACSGSGDSKNEITPIPPVTPPITQEPEEVDSDFFLEFLADQSTNIESTYTDDIMKLVVNGPLYPELPKSSISIQFSLNSPIGLNGYQATTRYIVKGKTKKLNNVIHVYSDSIYFGDNKAPAGGVLRFAGDEAVFITSCERIFKNELMTNDAIPYTVNIDVSGTKTNVQGECLIHNRLSVDGQEVINDEFILTDGVLTSLDDQITGILWNIPRGPLVP